MSSERPQRTTSYLVLDDGIHAQRFVIWDTVEVTVGRHDGQDIVVPDSEVSRRHCVFRHKDGVYTVEDLGSALGTCVGGEPVKVHELRAGDRVEVGSLTIEFGQTADPMRPGANVRFASQLKGLDTPSAAQDAGGRTMMAIDLSDELAPAGRAPSPETPRARAVSLDGRLEELDAPELLSPDALDPSADVRDLDAAMLDLFGDPPAPPLPPPPRPAPLAPAASAATAPTAPRIAGALGASDPTCVELVLEVAGPAAEVEALVAAIREKAISVPPLVLRVKDPRR